MAFKTSALASKPIDLKNSKSSYYVNKHPEILDDCLIVSISEQKMLQIKDRKRVKTYDISTSKNPPSCKADSNGTPLGLHKIEKKIGDGAEKGTVFRSRQSTKKKYWELNNPFEENLITTRILWLKGLEPGLNSGKGVDSFKRYIYIHGTNQEDQIGTPISHGCILLKNSEVIGLYNSVNEGTYVLVL